MPQLLCTVRDCHLPLVREERRVVCARGHSFDVARSGYINLLQPQDRRSANPGDSAEAVAARRRFLARGFANELVAATLALLNVSRDDHVLDVGCGEGHHLGAIVQHFGCGGHGVDISLPAIEAASKTHRDAEWIVANADRFVPYADASFGAVTSINARMNAPEFRRILRNDGTLLVAVAAPDDLLELRRSILGEGVERDRVERTAESFSTLFTLQRRERIRHTAHLDRDAVRDVMTSSYRGLRKSESERLASIDELDVTLSRDVLLFGPR